MGKYLSPLYLKSSLRAFLFRDPGVPLTLPRLILLAKANLKFQNIVLTLL